MTFKEPKITFASNRLGELVHISEIKEKGLASGCTCLKCGEPLVARLGAQVRHHFAHKADSSCSEAQAYAAYRLMVKVLREQKNIMLPTYKSILYYKRGELTTVEQVIDEEKSKGRMGFKIQTTSGEIGVVLVYRKLLNEQQKKSICQELPYCFAIDTSSVVTEDMNEHTIAEFLLRDTGKTWLSHREYDQQAEKARADFQKEQEEKTGIMQQQIRERMQQEEQLREQRRQEEEQRRQEREQRRQEEERHIQEKKKPYLDPDYPVGAGVKHPHLGMGTIEATFIYEGRKMISVDFIQEGLMTALREQVDLTRTDLLENDGFEQAPF